MATTETYNRVNPETVFVGMEVFVRQNMSMNVAARYVPMTVTKVTKTTMQCGSYRFNRQGYTKDSTCCRVFVKA